MTFSKNLAPSYQSKINEYVKKKEQFIDNVRNAIDTQTIDREERKYRLEVFDAFLLKATYSERSEFEEAFTKNFPPETDSIKYIHDHLCEINGFCKQTFSDEHEGYRNIYDSVTFLMPETKQSIREQLSKQLTEMIMRRTNTEIAQFDLLEV
jgi:hypothetical protein